MLVKTCFIIDISSIKFPVKISLPENILTCFWVNHKNIEYVKFFFENVISGEIESPFFVAMDYDGMDQEKITTISDYILSLSYHLQYEKTAFDTPVIGVHNQENIMQIKVRELFCEQGYDNVFFSNIHTSDLLFDKETTCNILQQRYRIFIESKPTDKDYFFVPVNTMEDLPIVLDKIASIEKEVYVEHSHVIDLLQILYGKATEIKLLSVEVGILKRQAASVAAYQYAINGPVNVTRKKVMEIVSFYNNEYEILPLWYKQFGHILKVIMGKRTFRSLFNDNTKKYKN